MISGFINLFLEQLVVALFVLLIFYIFGRLLLSIGLPQYYIEKYVLTLGVSIIEYLVAFSLLSLAGFKNNLFLFSFPIIDLSYLQSSNFLEKMVAYTSSATFVYTYLFLLTTPLISLYLKKFKLETELRHNKILVDPFMLTLIIVFFVSTSLLYFLA